MNNVKFLLIQHCYYSTVTGMEEMDETMDMENMMDTATVCAQIPQLTHGKAPRPSQLTHGKAPCPSQLAHSKAPVPHRSPTVKHPVPHSSPTVRHSLPHS